MALGPLFCQIDQLITCTDNRSLLIQVQCSVSTVPSQWHGAKVAVLSRQLRKTHSSIYIFIAIVTLHIFEESTCRCITNEFIRKSHSEIHTIIPNAFLCNNFNILKKLIEILLQMRGFGHTKPIIKTTEFGICP